MDVVTGPSAGSRPATEPRRDLGVAGAGNVVGNKDQERNDRNNRRDRPPDHYETELNVSRQDRPDGLADLLGKTHEIQRNPCHHNA